MPDIRLDAGDLNKRVRIERRIAVEGLKSAGRETWVELATVWANVLDTLPSRAERIVEGMNIAARPARVRIRYRSDVTSDMRVVSGDRVMQIIAGPAELGRRAGLEMIVQDYSTAGGQP